MEVDPQWYTRSYVTEDLWKIEFWFYVLNYSLVTVGRADHLLFFLFMN